MSDKPENDVNPPGTAATAPGGDVAGSGAPAGQNTHIQSPGGQVAAASPAGGDENQSSDEPAPGRAPTGNEEQANQNSVADPDKALFIEKSLLEILLFFRKFVITTFDCIVRPWRIVINTHLEIKKGPGHVPQGKARPLISQYINYFVFFVFWALLFLNYYKRFYFNAVHGLQESLADVINSVNSGLLSTSPVELLLQVLFILGGIFFIVWSLSYVLKNLYERKLGISAAEAHYFFKRLAYYSLSAFLCLQLIIPVFFNLTAAQETRIINWLMALYAANYLISVPYALANRAAEQPHGVFDPRYLRKVYGGIAKGKAFIADVIIVLLLSWAFAVLLIKPAYQVMANKLHYLDFRPSLRMGNPGQNEKEILFRYSPVTDSSGVLYADMQLFNEGKKVFFPYRNAVRIKLVSSPGNEECDTVAVFSTHIAAHSVVSDSAAGPFGGFFLEKEDVKNIRLVTDTMQKSAAVRLAKQQNGRRVVYYDFTGYAPINHYEQFARRLIDTVRFE